MDTAPVYLDVDKLATGKGTDTLFQLLSNGRRRAILYVLYSRAEPVPLPELAAEVAQIEGEGPPEELPEDVRQRVYISLYQSHLPKLTEYGLADYDEDDRLVSLTPGATAATVEANRFDRTRWHVYYAGLLGAGVVLAILVWLLNSGAGWQAVSLVTLSGLGLVVGAHVSADGTPPDCGSYLLLSDLV